jgi:hypothetical protein
MGIRRGYVIFKTNRKNMFPNHGPLTMTQPKPKTIRCPTCKKESNKEGNTFYPFRGERCKLIDLGQWTDGQYSIEGSDSFSETDESG